MLRLMLIVVLATWVAVPGIVAFGEAPDPVATEKKQDVLLRALVDELDRNKARLELEDLARPYFIEYALADAVTADVSATLGATLSSNKTPTRLVRTQVRVGSYELDNTNFGDAGYAYSRQAPVPIEDDYEAIRQAIWWTTDRNYKNVVETLARKKAFMETKLIEDKPNDFSREAPVVHFDAKPAMSLDLNGLAETARQVSAAFRRHPDVQRSRVYIRAMEGNRYLVNTEGTRVRNRFRRCSLAVTARVQADDGMELSDRLQVFAHTPDELPSVEELVRQCDEMVERLIAVKKAPKLDAYTGPVLFAPEAAAPLFLGRFGRNFTGGQRRVGSRSRPDDFAKKLGRRILPRSVTVVDDPTREEVAGVPVFGHYEYDEQGVKTQPVTLVEEGRLKALLMSRNPSREFDKSTGHGRGRPGAEPGCLIVTARDGATPEVLKQELIEACQDEGLEFGVRISSLGAGGPTAPLAVHKVYADGREELVRGTEIGRFDIKAFKRLLAVGDTPHVLNSARASGQTVVVPAMLFEELDLAKVDRDFDKPPILPSPLAR